MSAQPTGIARYGKGGREYSPYRYSLEWPTGIKGPPIAWVGLNPSTATEYELDPTLRRIRNYSRAWGFGRFVMLNVFPYRATDPADLWRWLAHSEDIEWCDRAIRRNVAVFEAVTECVETIVWAYGAGSKGGRYDVQNMVDTALGLREFAPNCRHLCLRKTKQGYPVHPLYQKADLRPRYLDDAMHLKGRPRLPCDG